MNTILPLSNFRITLLGPETPDSLLFNFAPFAPLREGLIQEDTGNLSRELRRLEEEGIYSSRTGGNVKFYSLNRSYPLFREVKKIVLNSADGKNRIKANSAINNSKKSRSKT
jgi:hypothetical protein